MKIVAMLLKISAIADETAILVIAPSGNVIVEFTAVYVTLPD